MTDAEAVLRFEAFVQHQEPAPQWEPVTPYDEDSRRIAEGKHPELIRDVFQPREVLDVGCGHGYIVKWLGQLGVEARGFDVTARSVSPNNPIWYGDIVRGISYWSVDLVICREVLEHLTVLDAVKAVRNLVTLSSRYIYVTTRFAKQPDHLLSVETEFDADPTHITCLTKPFLRTLFILEGCKSRPDLEAKMDWQKKGRCLVFEVS
jgi:SAM-dependent methyltransferase